MKKKTSRRGIDVNVDELDRIIDAAMREPLNENDGRTRHARSAYGRAQAGCHRESDFNSASGGAAPPLLVARSGIELDPFSLFRRRQNRRRYSPGGNIPRRKPAQDAVARLLFSEPSS